VGRQKGRQWVDGRGATPAHERMLPDAVLCRLMDWQQPGAHVGAHVSSAAHQAMQATVLAQLLLQLSLVRAL
jgi:hypothetical protein